MPASLVRRARCAAPRRGRSRLSPSRVAAVRAPDRRERCAGPRVRAARPADPGAAIRDRERSHRRRRGHRRPGGAAHSRAVCTLTLDTEDHRMKIKLTSIYVDDQEKALRFYTNVLGFVKKADFSQGPFRWLTVASPEETAGTELQLALNDDPAAAAYQRAMFQQGKPAAMFYTDDITGDYERIKARGAEFTMPPTDVTASTIAQLQDTCGNLIQLVQLKRW